jgi:hypothetical protein
MQTEPLALSGKSRRMASTIHGFFFSIGAPLTPSTAPQKRRFGALPHTESMGSFGTGRAQKTPNHLTFNAIAMAPGLQPVFTVTPMRSASLALGDEFVEGCRSSAGAGRFTMGVTHFVL